MKSHDKINRRIRQRGELWQNPYRKSYKALLKAHGFFTKMILAKGWIQKGKFCGAKVVEADAWLVIMKVLFNHLLTCGHKGMS